MPAPDAPGSLEEQIDQWRSYLRRRQAIHSVDVAELEDHLREQVAVLIEAGLATDEAFLVAVKRMGAPRRALPGVRARALGAPVEAARRRVRGIRRAAGTGPHGCHRRLLSCGGGGRGDQAAGARSGSTWTRTPASTSATLSLFVLPLLTGYFVWKRRLDIQHGPLAGRGVRRGGRVRQRLSLRTGRLHRGAHRAAPADRALAGRWASRTPAAAGARSTGRMDFIRFSGELFIYYVLIALGGGVLTAFMAMIFQAIGIDIEPFFESWLLPCGAAGAVLVASWLVEAKQSVIENMAPVLTRLFTPAVRRRAGHVPGDPAVDRTRGRHRAGACSSRSTCSWWWSSACCSIPSPPGTPSRRPASSTWCRSCW